MALSKYTGIIDLEFQTFVKYFTEQPGNQRRPAHLETESGARPKNEKCLFPVCKLSASVKDELLKTPKEIQIGHFYTSTRLNEVYADNGLSDAAECLPQKPKPTHLRTNPSDPPPVVHY